MPSFGMQSMEPAKMQEIETSRKLADTSPEARRDLVLLSRVFRRAAQVGAAF